MPDVQVDPRRVFVVHGRDLRLRDAVFTFLGAIGLQPLEFSVAALEAGEPTPYIGDILDAAFQQAQAILVLFTPDDEARLRSHFVRPEDPTHERELTPQARPNVIFEAGMAVGRNPKRTVLTEVGSLRPFSDIAGRHVVSLNNTTQRRQELALRLRAAGCAVDLTGTSWHTVGDLTADATQSAAPMTENTPSSSAGVATAFEPVEPDLRVLKLIASNTENYNTEYVLNNMSSLSRQQLLYHLEQLEEHGLIGRTTPTDQAEEGRFFITRKGREFMFTNNLF